MSTHPEQFSAARKSHIEAQLNYFEGVTAKAMDSASQVLQLNLNTARTSLEKSTLAMSQLLQVKDPRDLLVLTTQSQQNIESLLSYGRALFGIATGGQLNVAPPSVATLAPAPEPTPEPAPEVQAQPELFAPAESVVAAPQPVADVPLPVEAKPIAEAARKVAAKPAATKPAAAPLPAAAKNKVVVTGMKPVDAAPPVVRVTGKPKVEAPKAGAKLRKKH